MFVSSMSLRRHKQKESVDSMENSFVTWQRQLDTGGLVTPGQLNK